jgi:hypothetical protein
VKTKKTDRPRAVLPIAPKASLVSRMRLIRDNQQGAIEKRFDLGGPCARHFASSPPCTTHMSIHHARCPADPAREKAPILCCLKRDDKIAVMASYSALRCGAGGRARAEWGRQCLMWDCKKQEKQEAPRKRPLAEGLTGNPRQAAHRSGPIWSAVRRPACAIGIAREVCHSAGTPAA